MAATKKSSSSTKKRRYSRGASRDVASAVRRQKRGKLKSGPGGKGGTVKSRRQAIAIGLSEARAKGKKVPKKRATRRSAARRRSTSSRSRSSR